MTLHTCQQQLLAAILDADRDTANALLEAWATEHDMSRTVNELLEPVLEQIGEMWALTHQASLAQAYVAGKVAEDFLLRGRQSVPPQSLTSGCPVVIGNIEDDYHSLGRRLVVIFLRTAGWQAHDLGNDVPAAVFVDTARELGAGIIGVSAMMYSTALNIKKVRQEIDQRGLAGQIKLAVGGAVFRLRPELVAEVGGDGTAHNAMQTPALFTRLWQDLDADKSRANP